MTTLVLPWPPRELSPNSRKDRRHTTKQRSGYREAAWAICKASNGYVGAKAHLDITFHPPDARRRDLDNMLASTKSALDGIALAAGVDDYGWSLSLRRADPIRPHGEVRVTISNEGET